MKNRPAPAGFLMPHTSSHSMSVTSYEAAIHRNDAIIFFAASDANINVQRRGLSAEMIMSKLRVWHIPQVPMKAFFVEVNSVEEGVRMMDALAGYDLFQLNNNIKPDYSNVNGLQMWDENLTEEDMADMELTDRWVDWYSEYYDDPREYLESLSASEAS